MTPLVSVIVPVYNVESYLPKCIDSILEQTLSNIEVILINDGSTDNSGNIIDDYAKRDQRIITIHKENGGQGSARNEGLKIAKGKYIGFVDADDWIDKDMYEKLTNVAVKENSDLVVCGRKVFNIQGELKYELNLDMEVINIKKNNLLDYIVEKLFFKHTVVVYNKIYRNDIIRRKNLFFKEVSEVGSEDTLFNYCYLMNTQKICSLSAVFHNQLAREGSTAREYKFGAMKRTANLLRNIQSYSNEIGCNEVGLNTLPIFLLFFQQWNYNLLKNYSNNFCRDFRMEHKSIASDKLFKSIEKKLVLDKSLECYYKKLGYSPRGIAFMRLYMLFSYFKFYSLATALRKAY